MALKMTPSMSPSDRLNKRWEEIEELVSDFIVDLDLRKADDRRKAFAMLDQVEEFAKAKIAEANGDTAPSTTGTAGAPAAVTPTGTTAAPLPPAAPVRPTKGGLKFSFGRKPAATTT